MLAIQLSVVALLNKVTPACNIPSFLYPIPQVSSPDALTCKGSSTNAKGDKTFFFSVIKAVTVTVVLSWNSLPFSSTGGFHKWSHTLTIYAFRLAEVLDVEYNTLIRRCVLCCEVKTPGKR